LLQLPDPSTRALFRVEVQPDRERVIVAPHGEIDISTVDTLRTRIEELEQSGFEHLLLDLRGVEFLDTTGLRLIIEQTRRTDVEFGVIPGAAPVQRVFEISGMLDSLPFVDRPPSP
jgi:anti-sigma B factor antagonist